MAETSSDAALARLLCPLFVEVARADAPMTREEVRVAREYFERRGFSVEDLEHVRSALKRALSTPALPLKPATEKARKQLPPDERPDFVHALYELALVDGDLKRAESDAIKEIIGALNLSEQQVQKIAAAHLGDGSPHYATLGLKEDASDDDIRTAFKRLAREFHPDRAKGPQAAARFQQINDAYQGLRKLRGL